jgi:iron(III) transport system permease protein
VLEVTLTEQPEKTIRAPADADGPPRGPIRRILARADVSWILPGIIALVICYLTVVPIVMMVVNSFRTGPGTYGFDHYVNILTSGAAWGLIWHSLVFAAGAAVFGTAAGALLAWLVERTNMPGRRLFFAAALVPLIVPGSLSTFGWVLLLSPRIGLINVAIQHLTGLKNGPLNVYSMPGMIFVEGLHLSSLAFLLISAALRSMDASLEEAASAGGARVLEVARRITLPLLMPALASTLLLGFVRAIEGFEVPAMIGLPGRQYVLASQIYLALSTFPIDQGAVGTYSTLLFVVGALGVLLYLRTFTRGRGFTTVTGKGFRPRVIDLRGWRLLALAVGIVYILVMFALPVLIMVWSSLLPFYAAPSLEALHRVSLKNYTALFHNSLVIQASRNSLIVGVAAATVVVIITAVSAWITVRTRIKGRQLLDVAAFLPIAIPGLVLGVAMVDLYASAPIKIYGTVGVLIITFAIRFMPYGMRANSASIMQIHPELEEAAAVTGANWYQSFTRVLLPLLRPGLFAAWVYVFIVSMRELSSAIILSGPRNIPLAVLIYDLYTNGEYTVLSALGVVMVVVLTLLVWLFQRLGGKPTEA